MFPSAAGSSRGWVALFVTLAGFATAQGQLPPTPQETGKDQPARPQLYVAQRSIDLGTVLEGDKVTATWMLENRGNADLVIDHTAASCGCTVVQLNDEEKVIPAGGTLALKAQFDSANRRDEQVKTISVHSNDPTEPDLRLEFKATVDFVFEMDPVTMLNLRTVRRGDGSVKTLDFYPGGGRESLTLRSVQVAEGTPLNVEYGPFEGRRGAGQRIRFLVDDSAPLGQLNSEVKVELTVDGIDRERSIPIRGEVVADLTWLPKVLDATRQTSLPGKKLPTVSLRSTAKTPVRILEASAGPLFDVTVEAGKSRGPEQEHAITASLRQDAKPGPFASILRVVTDSFDQPIVEVPIFGIVASPVEVDPPLILLRDDGSANGMRRRIKVQAALTSTMLEISHMVCDNPLVVAEIDRQASGRYQHIRFVEVKLAGRASEAEPQATLRLTTNVAGAEQVEVPVRIQAGAAKTP